MKYNQNLFIYLFIPVPFYLFIYLNPFFGFSPRGQTHRRIFTHDGSNDADSRKDVPSFGFRDMAPYFGGVNRRFQGQTREIEKHAYYQN